MKKNKQYVVAFYSAHTGMLVQNLVYAKSTYLAALAYLNISSDEFPDMTAVLDFCANTDTWISILEINNTLTE